MSYTLIPHSWLPACLCDCIITSQEMKLCWRKVNILIFYLHRAPSVNYVQ